MRIAAAVVCGLILVSCQQQVAARPTHSPTPNPQLTRPSSVPTPYVPPSETAHYGTRIAALNASTALRSYGDLVQLTNDGGVTWSVVFSGHHGIQYQARDIEWVDASSGFMTTQDGLFRFDQGGRRWRLINPRLDLWRLDFLDANTGFVIVAATKGDFSAKRTVLRSMDGGLTFAPYQVGLQDVDWIQFVSASRAWAAGTDGIVATADGGATWSAQLTFPAGALGFTDTAGATHIQFRAQVAFSDEANGIVFYALPGSLMTQSGGFIYRTIDGGRHWSLESCTCGYITLPPVGTANPPSTIPSYAFASEIRIAGSSVAYLLEYSAVAAGVVMYRSSDAGARWSDSPLPTTSKSWGGLDVKSTLLWLSATEQATLIDAESRDGGRTWTVHSTDATSL